MSPLTICSTRCKSSFVNALKGAGDTRYILVVSVVMAFFLAGCSWLAIVYLHAGAAATTD